MIRITKTPLAVKDWQFDWSSWLITGDAIASKVITADAGINVDSSALSTGASGVTNSGVTVWLSGGTVGSTYQVTCHVTTTDGRQDDWPISVTIAAP